MRSVKEISAGVVIYRRTKEGSRFLLLYHGNNHWSFAKGHIEQGEKSIETAFREVAEETGIKQKDLTLEKNFKVSTRFFYLREKTGIFRILIFYLAHTQSADVHVSWEHDGYAWFLFKDAMYHMKYKNLKDVLKKANQFINDKNKKIK